MITKVPVSSAPTPITRAGVLPPTVPAASGDLPAGVTHPAMMYTPASIVGPLTPVPASPHSNLTPRQPRSERRSPSSSRPAMDGTYNSVRAKIIDSCHLDAPLPAHANQTGSKVVPKTRHRLMGLHLLTSVLAIVLAAICIEDRQVLRMELALGMAFLIYIPAAFVLTVTRQKSHFDHAGGEIAYLVVQQLGRSLIAYMNYTYVSTTECGRRWRKFENAAYVWITPKIRPCQWASVAFGLSASHALLLMGWMIWVIVLVYRHSPEYPERAFQISVGTLLEEERSNIGRTDTARRGTDQHLAGRLDHVAR